MKRLATILTVALALTGATGSAEELQTIAEKTAYTKTSLYDDVMAFLQMAQSDSDLMHIAPLAVSSEGRMIPLVILSKEQVTRPSDLALYGKPAVLVMANIHAGEVEGKEACQMLIRDIVRGKASHLLEHQVVLVIPIFNVDGNDKLGKNRNDNGPELAGVRPNGQNLDLNRDYVKLEAPEVSGLVALFNTWDPILTVDLHTTNGSYHRHPVTWAGPTNPNTDPALVDYTWSKLFPAVEEMLRGKHGFRGIPYGNFVDSETPEKGWENDTADIRYGTNYIGLRNRFSILDENYSHADFKTRVLGCYALAQAILEHTAQHGTEMAELVRRVDRATASGFAKVPFAYEYKMTRLFDVTIESFVFEKRVLSPEERERYFGREFVMRPTETQKDYRIPYLGKAEPTRTATLSDGYVLFPADKAVMDKLRQHGIRVERLVAPFKARPEQFTIEKIELDKNLYQGHVQARLTGHYQTVELQVPAGAYYVPLRQPLGRLVAALLEPDFPDSLAAWGFFNRVIVQQWSSRPGTYPVYRLDATPPVPSLLD